MTLTRATLQRQTPLTQGDPVPPLSRSVRTGLVLAAIAAAALSAPADAARKAKPIRLTETTTITAVQSGWVDVALYDDARLSALSEKNPDVDVTGTGRLLRLTMTSLGTDWNNTDSLDFYRLPSFLGGKELVWGTTDSAGSCTDGMPVGPTTIPVGGTCSYTQPKHIVLHEGRYRLSVLTDGAPVTFSLRLHGLEEGATTLRPSQPLASIQKPLPKLDSADNKLVSFGSTAHIPKADPAFIVTSAKGSVEPTFSEESTCARQDGSVPPPPLAYGPHCPNGVAGSYSYTLKPGGTPAWFGGMGVFTGSVIPGHEGDYGIGGSFGDSGGVTLLGALGVWLEPTPTG